MRVEVDLGEFFEGTWDFAPRRIMLVDRNFGYEQARNQIDKKGADKDGCADSHPGARD